MSVMQFVRFHAGMPEEQVFQKYENRAPLFRETPGLLQKYYLRYPTGEHGAVYVWESKEAQEEYSGGSLSASIASAYEVEGDVTVEVADLVMSLR